MASTIKCCFKKMFEQFFKIIFDSELELYHFFFFWGGGEGKYHFSTGLKEKELQKFFNF